MRVLVLSDTHGHLHLINKLAAKHSADFVLHGGDFGFYAEDRLTELPDRELSLRIRHNEKLPHLRKKAFSMSREEKIDVVRKYHLEGEFELYISGKVKFEVPVYCVAGNHEDDFVVRQIIDGTLKIHNLHILTEDSDVVLGEGMSQIRLAGIGGNFIHWTFFDREGTNDFYPEMRFVQWVKLLKRFPRPVKEAKQPVPRANLPKRRKGKDKAAAKPAPEELPAQEKEGDAAPQRKPPLIMLTHVSPGKIPSMELLSTKLDATLWFSGHMGPRVPESYTLFTICDDYEFALRSKQEVDFFLGRYHELSRFWRLWYACEELHPFQQNEISEFNEDDFEFEIPSPSSSSSPSATSPESTPETAGSSTAPSTTEPSTSTSTSSTSGSSSSSEEAVYKSRTDFPEKIRALFGIVGGDTAIPKAGDPIMLPAEVRPYIFSSSTPEQLAKRVRKIVFIAPHTHFDKRKKLKCMQKYDSPNPRFIPTKEEIALIEEGLNLFKLPFVVPPDAHNPESRAKRTPSDLVKQTPQFYNLPDAYLGGHVILDIDKETGQMQITTVGNLPQRSIIQEADDPWRSIDTSSEARPSDDTTSTAVTPSSLLDASPSSSSSG